MNDYGQNLNSGRNAGNSYPQRDRRNYQISRGVQEHSYPPNYHPPSSGMDDMQRWVSGVGGAAVLFYGLRQQNLSRWPLAVLGAGLIYQGVSGHNLLDYLPIHEDENEETSFIEPVTNREPHESTELRIRKSVTINRPAAELYSYWRKLSNLPTFMTHVKSVEETSSEQSHWVVDVVHGMQLEWDARITVDRPNEMIAWETLPDSTLQNRGYVKFIPTSYGTEVSVSLEYDPPVAVAGALVGRALKFIPATEIKDEIRHFKALMEAGEIPTTDGQSSARSSDRKQEQPAALNMSN